MSKQDTNKRYYDQKTGKVRDPKEDILKALRKEALRAYRAKEELNPEIVEAVLDYRTENNFK